MFDLDTNTWTVPKADIPEDGATGGKGGAGGSKKGHGHHASSQVGGGGGAVNTPGVGPLPRGEHTATLVGHTLFIFGGYGGVGYARRDLNDLFCLNLNTWIWEKMRPTGTAPEVRAGHSKWREDDE